MPGTDLRRVIDDMSGGSMVPCLVTLRLVQLGRLSRPGTRTVPLRETVRPVGHIDLVLDREHDAHGTGLGQVCEFD